ncbi:DUF5685 family protein [Lachnoclostridium sp. Marseille-P6806]|uniref:DUF5685 family protein n=1 Tax=Lachnoclostridium sp. Marseille-P6806 TaxID=2364793 RepID=UPI00102FF939|nr:DUF5685 family protein [Lachnoclostridium sp. Marseille-P6806]
MFGYIVVNQPELRLRELELYRSYYCGLCRVLKQKYGAAGQLTLSYDTTFLTLLLSGLYEPEDTEGDTRCAAHPFERHATRINEFTEYAADMNVILSYWSCIDDWKDERRLRKLFFAKLLSRRSRAAASRLREKSDAIALQLRRLGEEEKRPDADLDTLSGCFGEIMAEALACRHDDWEPTLRRMGFFLGKFIYIMDAWDDLEKDRKSGAFNPLLRLAAQMNDDPDDYEDDFDRHIKHLLTMMMAECAKCFETLPIVKNAELLRNILYSGVWTQWNRKTAASAAAKTGTPRPGA